jgi:hypothetical protein
LIALLTTYFLVFYILIPGILFRFSSSLFVRLKLFQRTRTQEATFAVAVALLPFLLTLFGVWNLPVLRHHPFRIAEGTPRQRRQDYQRAIALIASPDPVKSPAADNLANPEPAANQQPLPYARDERQGNWHSLNRVLRRQARFLTWYFVFTIAEGLLFGYLAGKYGDWKIAEPALGASPGRQPGQPIRRSPLIRVYNWFAPRFILPNISEWFMLLTGFSWPRRENALVVADILQNDGHLYRGRVEDYFIDSDGKLTGILLHNVSRFDLPAYRKAQDAAPDTDPPSSERYWKTIPSVNFYIGQSAISNLNIRFAPRQDSTLVTLAGEVLQGEDLQADYVVMESPGDPSRPETAQAQPDLYS